MISHDYKCVFIHVTKTGGTSIEKALGLSGPRHNTARQYREHFPEIWGRYFSFGFVRNPWDRLLSYYMFRRQTRRLAAETSLTFKEWLVRAAERVRSESHAELNAEFAPVHGVGTLVENDPEGWRVKLGNALHMLTDQQGTVIVDYIGRFERLQLDFDIVCEKLNLRQVVLPNINKAEHEPYWKYYDDDCQQIVMDLCKEDIAHFGYAFGD